METPRQPVYPSLLPCALTWMMWAQAPAAVLQLLAPQLLAPQLPGC